MNQITLKRLQKARGNSLGRDGKTQPATTSPIPVTVQVMRDLYMDGYWHTGRDDSKVAFGQRQFARAGLRLTAHAYLHNGNGRGETASIVVYSGRQAILVDPADVAIIDVKQTSSSPAPTGYRGTVFFPLKRMCHPQRTFGPLKRMCHPLMRSTIERMCHQETL